MTIYDRIKDLRIKSGMTQDDLAHALGYKDRSMITKIEGGKVDISQKKIVAFAKVLNTTPRYLLDGDEKTADPIETLREKIRTKSRQREAFRHEIRHLIRNDLTNEVPIKIVEGA